MSTLTGCPKAVEKAESRAWFGKQLREDLKELVQSWSDAGRRFHRDEMRGHTP
jgi:hypothetical protein